MSSHPYLLLAQVKQHQFELIAEADRARLLHTAREARKARKVQKAARRTG